MTYNFFKLIELFARIIINFYLLLDMIYDGRIVYNLIGLVVALVGDKEFDRAACVSLSHSISF